MYYALIYRPKIDTSKIDYFQKQYDPYYELAGAHFTLVFPTLDKVNERELIDHIHAILKKWQPFKIHINGLEKSWDNWLFLNVKKGEKQFIRLHDELYTGSLKPYLRSDLPYKPHISLGLFVEERENYNIIELEKLPLNQKEFEKAYQEASELNLDYYDIVDKVELFTLDDDMKKVLKIKKFPFGKR